VNGNTTGYLYDGAQAIAELRSNAIDTVYHVGLAIDEVLARYGSAGSKSLLTDALGSVIAQADDAQNTQNFYGYSPYGESQVLGTDDGNSLQYAGRENDQTGLYYYRARYYDPVLKRFIAEDPIGIAGGIHPYAYVRNNPISGIDPQGTIYYAYPGMATDIAMGEFFEMVHNLGLRASGVVALAEISLWSGWQVGTLIREVVEDQMGDNIGGRLYDWTHPQQPDVPDPWRLPPNPCN
jgi:RHS repeat-associated protein